MNPASSSRAANETESAMSGYTSPFVLRTWRRTPVKRCGCVCRERQMLRFRVS